jgi:xanthine phosphoribosyltransferase
MKALHQRILNEGRYLGRGILKVDSFLNHQLDPALTLEMGQEFYKHFTHQGVKGVTKIVTAETSGIAPALMTALSFNVPVVYARKKRPITMPDGFYSADAPSHTKGGITTLMISPEYLHPDDRVVIIDDFLATGLTTDALVNVVQQCGATLLGIGAVIEKAFEHGRTKLEAYRVPIVSLAIIEKMDEDGIHLKT